jgi:hypothetical protein
VYYWHLLDAYSIVIAALAQLSEFKSIFVPMIFLMPASLPDV